jgi:transposase
MEQLQLNASDRDELESRARSRVLRAEDVRRARLILPLADGEPYKSIQSKLQCNRSYVSRWKGRFAAEGSEDCTRGNRAGDDPF